MKILFIGGTGNISAAASRLVVSRGHELYLLNRGKRGVSIPGAEAITGDIDIPGEIPALVKEKPWDVVVNWIAFRQPDVERDILLFEGRIGQYVFISSATVYQKPPLHPVITESAPLGNPFWEYARDKIACELRLNRAYRDQGFPVTIVRPSHTYETVIPLAIGGWQDYGIIARIKRGGKVVVHGDGTSLWTVTHSEDFARGFVGLLGHGQGIGHGFHITSDELLTWNQIYRSVAEAAGAEARLVHIPSELIARLEPTLEGTLLGDKAHSVIFDNSKIKRYVPGWRAVIPFREGIRRCLAWFEESPERMKSSGEDDRLLDRLIDAYGYS
ncbi:MAG: NAD-dependent epimerase/dehydratase family protein [Spirochaetales bacterium]|nr:NAD-dependent epimerase/dehydratase family protein [Spirochaetales bacterium]